MNVLLLTHQGGTAGSTYSTSYLAQGLAERGHKIFVGCKTDSLLYQLCEKAGIQCIPMTFRNKTDVDNMRQIHSSVEKYNIDLVNAQSGIDRYTSILAKYLFKFKAPVVHTRRQTPKSAGFFLQNWLYTRGTAKIVAVSEGVKKELVKLGLPAHHIQVIYNGTPRSKYLLKHPGMVQELRNHYRIKCDDRVIGCVSRPKQQQQILQALQFISTPMTVFFIGADEKPEWKAITQTFQVPHRIYYLGNIPQEQVLYHYKLFDVHVLASVTEGLSQALLEAMAMEVPVIASDAAGNQDLIQHGENGLLFEPGNPKQLAGQIELLLGQPRLQTVLRKNGIKTALADFSIEKTVENYEKLYASLIRKNGKR